MSGYEITFRTTPVYRVRGIVLGENGKPALRALVSNAAAAEQYIGASMFSMTKSIKGGPLGYFTVDRSAALPSYPTDGLKTTEGVFEFPSVPRGMRQFTAFIEQQEGPPMPATATVSAVVDRDIDDLDSIRRNVHDAGHGRVLRCDGPRAHQYSSAGAGVCQSAQGAPFRNSRGMASDGA